MPVYNKVGGIWKDVPNVYNKVSGVWRNSSAGYVKVGGVWRTVYPTGGTGSDYGYTAGGYASLNYSSIDRVTFPFASGTASYVGNLNATKRFVSGFDGVDFVTQFV